MSAAATVRLAAAGVSSHLLYQVSARVASFAIKSVVVRALKPAQFALVEIRLYLLVALCLMPMLQGFRPVALRVQSDADASALNMVCAFITMAFSLILCAFMMHFDQENRPAVLIVVCSLLIRSFVETPVVVARRRQRYSESSRARAIAVVVSGVMQTIAVSLVVNPAHAAPATSIGHIAYSLSLGIAMYFACGAPYPQYSFSALFKAKLEHLAMVLVATGEGLIKFILENGEGFILDAAVSPTAKAAYRLSGNLGSVLARMFSEALEEQSFNVFHRLAPSFRKDKEDTENQKTCIDTLLLAVKAAITISLLFCIVGPAYSYSVLRLLYGEKWADSTPAPRLLDLYFVYLVFMSLNGVSEAFVSASASTAELRSRTKFSTALSVCYLSSLYYCATHYQAEGVVFVNCCNMLIRSAYSSWFFQRLTGRSWTTLLGAIPHFGVIVFLVVARWISSKSESYFLFAAEGLLLKRIILHGFSGVFALILFALSLRVFEGGFISKVRSLGRSSNAHTD